MKIQEVRIEGKLYRPLKSKIGNCDNCAFANKDCTIVTPHDCFNYCDLFGGYPLQETKYEDAKPENSVTIIGNQIWSELLDIDIPGSIKIDSIRYYTWEQALEAAKRFAELYGEEWRLPSKDDFITLVEEINYDPSKLVEKGFIKAGRCLYGLINGIGSYGFYWSSTWNNGNYAHGMGLGSSNVWLQHYDRSNYFAVRCVQNKI